jgi:cell wall-associated NlpC family hydrolase
MKHLPLALALCLLLASCSSSKQQDYEGGKLKTKNVPAVISIHEVGQADALETTYLEENGRIWIPAERVAHFLDYEYEWDANTFTAAMGYTDPIFKIRVNSKDASVGDETVQLNEAPRMFDGTLYVDTGTLSQLWQTPVLWNAATRTVVVTPRNDQPDADHESSNLNPEGNSFQVKAAEPTGAATALIAYAKKFMGTPYKFSSKAYNQTRTFDCSSYMQYIYKNSAGINLPRSSRNQSRVGRFVGKQALMPGDLVFFYTPGRFSSNKVVGHVGMYIGNNQVIHTYGKPGVTINSLTGNWSKRYLWARRVF